MKKKQDLVILQIKQFQELFFLLIFAIIKLEKRNHMSLYYNVKTTIDNLEIAEQITKTLLEKKLVSSIQRREVTSIWRYNNQIEQGKEYVLEMKTKKELFKEIEEEIKKIHNYEVAEIFAEEIKEGSKEYLDWIEKETR